MVLCKTPTTLAILYCSAEVNPCIHKYFSVFWGPYLDLIHRWCNSSCLGCLVTFSSKRLPREIVIDPSVPCIPRSAQIGRTRLTLPSMACPSADVTSSSRPARLLIGPRSIRLNHPVCDLFRGRLLLSLSGKF